MRYLNACWEYQASPDSRPLLLCPSSLYFFFRPTLVSITLGLGMPTTSTALALASAKSSPSETCSQRSTNDYLSNPCCFIGHRSWMQLPQHIGMLLAVAMNHSFKLLYLLLLRISNVRR